MSYEIPEDRLERIEEKLDDIESEMHSIKNKMLTVGKVLWYGGCILIGALWWDKIWGFIGGIFLLFSGLILKTLQGMFTATEPMQSIVAMILAGFIMLGLFILLVYGLVALIMKFNLDS